MSSADSKPRILVLLSGSGTNFAALLTATRTGQLSGRIIHVISNRKSAYGLVRAHEANIPTTYHNLLPYRPSPGASPDRRKYDADLAALILSHNPDLVVCAGWMHILSDAALDPLKEKGVDIINLHPALPGAFDGIDAIKRAWEAGKRGEVKETGCMVHHVIGEVDRGMPVVVRKVELKEGETLEELEERIHKEEHMAIVDGAERVLQERMKRLRGGKDKEGGEGEGAGYSNLESKE